MYRILVVCRIVGYWKRWVLGFGNMNVSWDQRHKLWPTCQGNQIRWLHKDCKPRPLILPTFSPPPPLSWVFRPHKLHLSNYLLFFCSTEQRKRILQYHWLSLSICESLPEASLSATSRHSAVHACRCALSFFRDPTRFRHHSGSRTLHT